MKPLTYGSLFSGTECMSAAAIGLPLVPKFFAEVEPYPCAILRSKFPDVPNLGDVTGIKYNPQTKEISNARTTVSLPDGLDILCGGSPCQDFSVAGKRAGADGDDLSDGGTTRSSLIFTYIRLLREIRPRYFIYENVPGMLTSNEGRDFAHFLVALGECGYEDVAWRVLDAQYVRVDGMERAVPQRRRRVWVVGRLGADYGGAAEILLEPHRDPGNLPPRRKTREEVAAGAGRWLELHGGMVGEAGRWWNGGGVADTLTTRCHGQFMPDKENFAAILANPKRVTNSNGGDVAPTLTASIRSHTEQQMERGGGYVIEHVTNSNGENVAPCLTTELAHQTGNHQLHSGGYIIEKTTNSNGGDVMPTIMASEYKQLDSQKDKGGGYIIATFENHQSGDQNTPHAAEVAPTMGASHNASCANNNPLVVATVHPSVPAASASTAAQTAPQNPQVFAKVSHPRGKDGEGERWAQSNVAGTRNVFDGERAQEVVVEKPQTRPAVCVAENIIGRADNAGGNGVGAQEGVSYTLDTVAPHAVCYDGYNQRAHDELCMTLRSAATGAEGNDADPKVCVPTADNGGRPKSTCLTPGDPIAKRVYTADGASPTLRSIPEGSGISSEAFVLPLHRAAPIDIRNATRVKHNGQGAGILTEQDASPTLCAEFVPGVAHDADDLPRVIVRRLTPTECERLMGLPDGWTRVTFTPEQIADDALVEDFRRIHDAFAQMVAKPGTTPKPKTAKFVRDWLTRISDPATCPDAPRYKACGNGWAANQPRWILFNLLALDNPNWQEEWFAPRPQGATAYGINAQASLMHPCTREVSQTLTVCNQGGGSTANGNE